MQIEESKANDFVLPRGLTGRFAVVKLWPELKTAEDECIARLKIAAASLNLECVEIHPDGRLLNVPDIAITKKDVDFVLHLHYDTPKFYDVFSFVALWNPLQFYHEWGYQRTSRNLLSHDDFVSCSSSAADDHVARMVRQVSTHLTPQFNLYHSTPNIVHPPSLGDQKLFYIGINWEAINGGKSRHQDVLKRLDKTGLLRIYGPAIFLNTNVWKGYESYVREIPFDGVSMLDEISKAGVVLVLSSKAHKASELMSNRLFEGIAAGALVICDENKFASKFFGDSLLYIDSRCSVEKIFEDIQWHLAWAKANPEAALAKISRAQEIFKQKFSLKKNLKDLYMGFNERKLDLLKRQGLDNATPSIKVGLNLLLSKYTKKALSAQIANAEKQDYKNLSPVLVIDKAAAQKNRSTITQALAKASISIDLLEIDFHDYGPTSEIKSERKFGEIVSDVISNAKNVDAVVLVAPNEEIFSNHIQVLAGSLIRNPDRQCVATASIVKNGDTPVHSVHEQLEFGFLNPVAPIGCGRFIFRLSGLPSHLEIALPYLHRKPLAALVGDNVIHQEIPSTIVIDGTQEFPGGAWNEEMENEVLGDFCPKSFAVYRGFTHDLPSLARRAVKVPVPAPRTRLSRRWVLYQIEALREAGVRERLKVLKARLGLGAR